MNFLFPLFALGLAALAIPILLHFRKQPPQKTVPFSSLMFLEASPVPPRARRRLEDWLLLLLRCLALALIALMFARPYVPAASPQTLSGGTTWCILVDVSASMKRDGAWEDARKKVDEALANVQPADRVMLASFHREPQEILGFEAWQSLPAGARTAEVQRKMAGMEPGWQATDLGRALRWAAGRLQGAAHETRPRQRVVLISDLQEGAALDELSSESWPEDVFVTPLVVTAPWKDNLTLSGASSLVEEGAAEVPAGATGAGEASSTPAAGTRVRVVSGRDTTVEKFSLAWQDEGGEPVHASVLPEASRMIAAPAREASAVDSDGTLQLQGDALSFDNFLYVARPKAQDIRILCLGSGLSRAETRSPLFYLARALQPTPAVNPVLVEKGFDQFSAQDLPGTSVVFAFGDGNAASLALLQGWVRSGGALVYVPQPGENGSVLKTIAKAPEISLAESPSKEALLQDLNFNHVLLQAFANAGVRDFTKIRFWKHRLLQLPENPDPSWTVVARFDDRSPAWVEVPVGKGKMLYMGGGWAPGDSQLAMSSKFVPLIYATLEWATGRLSDNRGYQAGDRIPATAGNWSGPVSVAVPEGKTVLWDAGQFPFFEGAVRPGIYRFGSGESAHSVAVNLAPTEGRLAPIPVDRLVELGVKVAPSLATDPAAPSVSQMRLEEAKEEQQQKVWKLLLLAALVILIVETWLAGTRGRPSATSPPQLAS